MASSVLLPSDFSPASLSFSPLMKNAQGGKQVFVSMEGSKTKIVLQTPTMTLPFGITPYTDPVSGLIQSWSMDVSFRDNEEFMQLMRDVDTKVMEGATERSPDWFGKPMTHEIVSEFCRKMVKDPNNPQYAATMKIKIPSINGEETTKFYDENREVVPLSYVTKGSKVKVIMELSPVWFLNKNLGMTWKALQVAVISRPGTIDEFAFVDESTGTVVAEEM